MKGMCEVGVEVVATPYQGPAIETLWWRAEPNPAKFQGDAFNAFNHTQFSGFGTSFYAANFGIVTSARAAREMQLGLRLRW